MEGWVDVKISYTVGCFEERRSERLKKVLTFTL